jgi:hypothetical protein
MTTLLICLCAVQANVRADYPFTEFVTSYWYGPPAKFTTLERYKEIQDANFNLVFPAAIGGMSVEQNRKMLDVCQQLGMKALIADARMVTAIGKSAQAKAQLDAIVRDYSDHPALFGYYIVDEPSASQFEGLAEVNAYLHSHDPKHPGFINLFPVHADKATQLGTATYEEYVDRFITMVKPFVISYDHYHFVEGSDGPQFAENLAIIRNASVKHGIPFWNIVLCVQHYSYRHLTEGELRFEAMQTLAFGAKGLLWYTYWYPGEPNPSVKHAMINSDGSRDPHYGMIQAINADARALGNELFSSKSWATFHLGEGGTLLPPKENPVELAGGKGQLTIGILKAPDGKTLALIANRDYKKAVRTFVIVKPRNEIQQFNVPDKSWSTAMRHELGYAVDLAPGAAILLRW